MGTGAVKNVVFCPDKWASIFPRIYEIFLLDNFFWLPGLAKKDSKKIKSKNAKR